MNIGSGSGLDPKLRKIWKTKEYQIWDKCTKGPQNGGMTMQEMKAIATSLGISSSGRRKTDLCYEILKIDSENKLLPTLEEYQMVAQEVAKLIKLF